VQNPELDCSLDCAYFEQTDTLSSNNDQLPPNWTAYLHQIYFGGQNGGCNLNWESLFFRINVLYKKIGGGSGIRTREGQNPNTLSRRAP